MLPLKAVISAMYPVLAVASQLRKDIQLLILKYPLSSSTPFPGLSALDAESRGF
jgi:hypothetical protein